MNDLKVSESFANVAAKLQTVVSSDTGQTTQASAAKTPLSISYDGATGGYRISGDGVNQSFARSDVIASGLRQVEFRKETGNASESLFLTSNSGGTCCSYVGGGLYEKLINGSGQVSATDLAFTYGYPSRPSQVPTTGKALFGTFLFGTLVTDTAYRLRGSGVVVVDFATGQIRTQGLARQTRVYDNADQEGPEWAGSSRISSGSSSFDGDFTLGGVSAKWEGAFYGPSGNEVGATFYGQSPDSRAAFAGFMIGKAGPTAELYRFIPDLPYDVLFETQGAKVQFRVADGSYTYKPGSSEQVSLAAKDIVSAESDARYTIYRKIVADGTEQLKLFNPGGANPDIKLSYTTFGNFLKTIASGAGTIEQSYFAVMGVTGPTILDSPRNGRATYNAQIYGDAMAGLSPQVRKDLRGAATFIVNFDASTFEGSMLPILINRTSGQSLAYDPILFTSGFASGRSFLSDLSQNNAKVGSMSGLFYGPDGVELGGQFQFRITDVHFKDSSGFNPVLSAQGVVVGKLVP
ncbi:transferrin-binding protein-like solute binding protein [Novosphingobium sp. THN1]|uniref:transferrin-binding protein-like solute binding protein n=1 Tax=Novosphingobium sp. THN1 TaxID=1016987 RepID=UPI0013C2C949|nr:transferrin-binding protein-like solute binding protein [Novosphingobium sp. THN1]